MTAQPDDRSAGLSVDERSECRSGQLDDLGVATGGDVAGASSADGREVDRFTGDGFEVEPLARRGR